MLNVYSDLGLILKTLNIFRIYYGIHLLFAILFFNYAYLQFLWQELHSILIHYLLSLEESKESKDVFDRP